MPFVGARARIDEITHEQSAQTRTTTYVSAIYVEMAMFHTAIPM